MCAHLGSCLASEGGQEQEVVDREPTGLREEEPQGGREPHSTGIHSSIPRQLVPGSWPAGEVCGQPAH